MGDRAGSRRVVDPVGKAGYELEFEDTWMIGYEDQPDRSAEICICEIFGRNVTAGRVGVGMGFHPFGDPGIRDEFSVEDIAIDALEFHIYTAEWTPEYVAFFVDHRLIKTVEQSPGYPMQFMLGIYEFPGDGRSSQPPRPYLKRFIVDYFRGYRPRVSKASSANMHEGAVGPRS